MPYNELLKEQSLCVFGEPGLGKSRLLQELYGLKTQEGVPCVFVDLKQVESFSIIDYIKQRLAASGTYQKSEWSFKSSEQLGGDGLANAFLFLDALDEVALERIPKILWEVQHLAGAGTSYTVVLSCRTHHAERFLKEFRSTTLTYCMIRPFSPHQVADYLKLCSPTLDDLTTRQVMDKLDKHYHRNGFFDWSSTLNTPRYLEYFGALLKEHSFDYVADLTRCELFEKFIDARLKVETNKPIDEGAKYQRKIPYLKQCFQRIALVMEIQRTNRISKNDLASFDMDASLGISSQLLLEVFYDGTLLKDNGDYLEFDNTEFQEYLAAMALSQLGRTEQVIFDLAINECLQMVYESWFNPISFLIELNPELLLAMVNLGVRTEDTSLFKLIDYAPVQVYSEGVKGKIYEKVVNYHLDKQQLFTDHSFSKIGAYFNPGLHESPLFEAIDGKPLTLFVFTVATIAAEVIRSFLARGGSVADLDKNWSKAFLELIDLENRFGTVMNSVIFNLLPLICSQAEFEKSDLQHNRTVGDVFNGTHQFYKEVAPNSTNGIDVFIAKVIANNNVSYDSPFEKITTKKGFQYLFQQLFDKNIDRKLYQAILSNYKEMLSEVVVQNLIAIYDDEIEQLLLTGLNTLLGFRHLFGRSLPDRIVTILQSQHEDIIPIIAKNIPEQLSNRNDIPYNYGFLFARLLSSNTQAEQLAGLLKDTEENRHMLRRALIHTKAFDTTPVIEKYFPDQIAIWAANNKDQSKAEAEQERRIANRLDAQLDRFRELLVKKASVTSTFYLELSDDQKAQLTPVELKKLKQVTLTTLNDFAPLDGRVSVKQTGDRTRTITQTRKIQYFKDAVLLIPQFGIDPTPHREKIFQALLFTYKDEETDIILELLANISPAEIRSFTNRYSEVREDDLLQESVRRFTTLCKNIKGLIEQATPLLKTWATTLSIYHYDRIGIINMLAAAREETAWLRTTFEHYETLDNTPEQQEVLQSLNFELLKIEDAEAVTWRIDLVLENAYDREESNSVASGARWVPDYEGLSRPLGTIKSRIFLPQMLSYLEKSFEILATDPKKKVFAESEVWNIVVPYLVEADLTTADQERTLTELYRMVAAYPDNASIHWFYSRIERIKRKFLERSGEPTAFGDAVKQYLQIRSKQYLDIAYANEVFQLVKEVINEDLRDWVRQGAYRFIGTVLGLKGEPVRREDLIQKTIVTQLGYHLLKRGFRDSDTSLIKPVIFREAQLLDDKRVDLVITYGAIGSVMVEIKRMGNGDLDPGKLVAYKEKFLAYLQQTHCDYGIYLIFLDREEERKNFEKKLAALRELYSENNIVIIGIDCLGDSLL